jgi:hypothetical protein
MCVDVSATVILTNTHQTMHEEALSICSMKGPSVGSIDIALMWDCWSLQVESACCQVRTCPTIPFGRPESQTAGPHINNTNTTQRRLPHQQHKIYPPSRLSNYTNFSVITTFFQQEPVVTEHGLRYESNRGSLHSRHATTTPSLW